MNNDRMASWQSLRAYVASMRHVVSLWEDFFRSQTIDWMSNQEILDWMSQIKVLFDVLEELHLYDELSSVSVRTNSSGFPDERHLTQVELLSEESEDELENIDELKRMFLDNIFLTGEVNFALLEKIAKARAGNILHKSDVLKPFEITKLQEVESSNGCRAYVCSWNRYVVQQLPVKYVMLFETSGDVVANQERLDFITRVLREETSLIYTLNDLAKTIDRSAADVHPKWIGRIILGPVFLSHLTTDDHQLQKELDDATPEGEIQSASRIIYEYLVAESEDLVQSLTDAQGGRHERLQKYAVRNDGEHCDRGVTHLEKHLFAPHRVVQRLSNEFRTEINHQLNSYGSVK